MLESRTTVRGDFNNERAFLAGGADFLVPRAGSPSRSLSFIAAAGDDLATRHGTTTTTDWGMLTREECYAAVDDHGFQGEFETAQLFDADDTASIEIICDCCRGLGHPQRVCPSNNSRHRSLEHSIKMLESKLGSLGSERARRPPARGQRPPFTAQPRRYAPARRSDGSPFSPFSKGKGKDKGGGREADA